MQRTPIILCIGGHDPSGGAGIQADIETAAALGGRAMTLVTALTVQDTKNIHSIEPTPPDVLRRQLAVLQADVAFDAIKIGLIGDPGFVPLLAELLAGFAGPVVVDPVLAAGGGFDLDGGRDLAQAIRRDLLPHTTLLTPNRAEARRLTGIDDPQGAAEQLLSDGVSAVLLTGADEAESDQVDNLLLCKGAATRTYRYPLLPHRYHGSGCTLASACAVHLGLGMPLDDAVEKAQAFTWQALQRSNQVSDGQWLPTRTR